MILEPTVRSPALARAYCDDVLDSSGYNDRSEDARLVVSELVSNAIVHAGTDIEVNVLVRSDAVRIEVTDLGGGVPRAARSRGDERRGLPIVEALGGRWGVLQLGAGKTVWCELVR